MITISNFSGGARGVRVAWQCEEMGLAYRAVTFGYPVPAEYRAKYPLGSVPFLEDEGGVAIGESVAQMLYLAQRYGPTPLLPADPAAMARVLQITVASEASLGGLMNPMLGTKFAGDRKCGRHVCAGTGADEQAKFALQARGHCEGVGAANFDFAVNWCVLEQRRNKSIRHAFDEMAARHFAGQQRVFRRLHGNDASLWPAMLDGLAATGQCYAGAESADEGINR